MTVNRGKDFEKVIKESFEAVPNTSVDRLHDQMNGFAGSNNVCDFIVYHKPLIYYIECKSVHGNILPFSNITKNQWNGLLEKSKIDGVVAGIMCWWIDQDVTKFIPIKMLQLMKEAGAKSIRYDTIASNGYDAIDIDGTKKRVFFEYDMQKFFNVTKIAYALNNKEDIPRRSGIWPK